MAEYELKKCSIGTYGAVQAFIRRSFTIEQRLVQMQQSFGQLQQFRAMAAFGHGQSRRRLFEPLVKLSPTL